MTIERCHQRHRDYAYKLFYMSQSELQNTIKMCYKSYYVHVFHPKILTPNEATSAPMLSTYIKLCVYIVQK